jgi:hypothetical protein
LLNERSTPSGIRFAKAQVYGVNGLIILPDSWSSSAYYLNNVNQTNASFTSNIINDGWETLLFFNGAVFLPAGGYRDEDRVEYAGSMGLYYTSESNGRGVKAFNFDHNDVGAMTVFRGWGLSVRLVRDVERH